MAFSSGPSVAESASSGGGPSSGSVAMRVALTPDPWTFYIATAGSPGVEQVGYAMYRADGSYVRSFTFSAGDDDHGVRVAGDDIPTQQSPTGIEVLTGNNATSITGYMNGGEVAPDVGTFYLVLWVAQKSGGWNWNVGGAVSILAENESQGSIALDSSDLSATLNAHARPLHRYGGPGVYLFTNATFAVEHVFLGAADAPLASTHALVVTRPDGTEAKCLCTPRDAQGPNAWGPGTYTVRHEGIDVVLVGGTDMHLLGVDVELPRG
ncbi:MAG TPA: hypothetical protein VGB83_08710 [Actinomycetota bacterium]